MSISTNNLWVHTIWTTLDNSPLINPSVKNDIYDFMRFQFKDLGCEVRLIGGTPDHVQCLIKLNLLKSLAEVIKQVKGCSSHYINQNGLISRKFAWQKGYIAHSVSESHLEMVFHFIRNQEQYHAFNRYESAPKKFWK